MSQTIIAEVQLSATELIYVDAAQGTPEWLQARVGVVTASRFEDAVSRLADKKAKDGTVTRGAPTAKSVAYAAQVALERVAGVPCDDTFVNFAMRRGTELEPAARVAYEARSGNLVEEVGIVLTGDSRFGYSADGFIDDDGLVEIKCPMSAARMIEVWRDRNVDEWLHQIQGGLWLTGRAWCDLVVYDPRLAVVGRDLFVLRIARDEDFIDRLQADLIEFLGRVDANEKALRESALPDVAA